MPEVLGLLLGAAVSYCNAGQAARTVFARCRHPPRPRSRFEGSCGVAGFTPKQAAKIATLHSQLFLGLA